MLLKRIVPVVRVNPIFDMTAHTLTASLTAQAYDILIVDDNPANLRLLAALLEQCGYRARPAITGALALRAAAAARPDLILLDAQMPGLDGFEVCRRLKADPATAAIPVIFLTACDDAESRVRGFRLGAADYLTKPLQLDEVLARVRAYAALGRQRAQIP